MAKDMEDITGVQQAFFFIGGAPMAKKTLIGSIPINDFL
jgi:hypothetical protein